MVTGKLDRYIQKNETRPPSYITHKNKFKMDQRLKCYTQNYKNPRKRMQQNLKHCSYEYFIRYISPGKRNKIKNKKMELHEIKKVLHSKGNQQNKNSTHHMGVHILQR